MYRGKKILAIIPARGGSKGLPKKNIKNLCGKPLIGWTIEEALSSGFCDRLVISTDDLEIVEISKQFGADVPFIRPSELATDEAKGMDVLLHSVSWVEEHGQKFDLILLLQPTSPLRTVDDIGKSLDLLFEREADCIISVCESEHSPLWVNTISSNLSMKDFLRPEVQNRNRQDLGKYYRINGAIYLAQSDFLTRNKSFFGPKTYAYIMPIERSIDIDNEYDLQIASFLLSKKL